MYKDFPGGKLLLVVVNYACTYVTHVPYTCKKKSRTAILHPIPTKQAQLDCVDHFEYAYMRFVRDSLFIILINLGLFSIASPTTSRHIMSFFFFGNTLSKQLRGRIPINFFMLSERKGSGEVKKSAMFARTYHAGMI